MRKFLLLSATLAGIGIAPAMAATTVTIAPDVDTWVMGQKGSSMTYNGDIVVGAELPGTVQFIEVPKHKEYAFAVVNKKRVLLDRNTRKVIKIYN